MSSQVDVSHICGSAGLVQFIHCLGGIALLLLLPDLLQAVHEHRLNLLLTSFKAVLQKGKQIYLLVKTTVVIFFLTEVAEVGRASVRCF